MLHLGTAAVPVALDLVLAEHLYPSLIDYKLVLSDGGLADNTGLQTLR